MLKQTFLHLPGITPAIEQELWKNKIDSWHSLLDSQANLKLSKLRRGRLIARLNESIEHYESKDYSYFADTIPQKHHWRAYPELKGNCCFLDIETTGLSRHYNDITLIGMYDGNKSKFFINGKNMHEFPDEIRQYPMLVTFNGRCFDLPFIQAKFPKLDLNKFHIDLRYALKDIGYRGGLKNIERELGLERDEEIQGVDGFEAVRLWHRYKRGDEGALKTLVKYNQADIENLKTLMEFAFENLRKRTF